MSDACLLLLLPELYLCTMAFLSSISRDNAFPASHVTHVLEQISGNMANSALICSVFSNVAIILLPLL